MGRKKKVDMNELSQTHGALASPKSLEMLAGYKSPYTASSFYQYQEQIKAMTDIDLHDHAYTVGLTPIDNRVLLEDRLEKAFLAAQTQNIQKTIPNNMTPEARKRQEDFMKFGR